MCPSMWRAVTWSPRRQGICYCFQSKPARDASHFPCDSQIAENNPSFPRPLYYFFHSPQAPAFLFFAPFFYFPPFFTYSVCSMDRSRPFSWMEGDGSGRTYRTRSGGLNITPPSTADQDVERHASHPHPLPSAATQFSGGITRVGCSVRGRVNCSFVKRCRSSR